LTLTQIHPGVTVDQVKAATGWELKVSADLAITEEPDPEDLRVLRDLKRRTEIAHAGG
jgi:glutaconate CoA-transferase, subunit B